MNSCKKGMEVLLLGAALLSLTSRSAVRPIGRHLGMAYLLMHIRGARGRLGRLLSHSRISARSHPTAAFPSRIRRGKSPAFSSRSIVGLDSLVIAFTSANRSISLRIHSADRQGRQ